MLKSLTRVRNYTRLRTRGECTGIITRGQAPRDYTSTFSPRAVYSCNYCRRNPVYSSNFALVLAHSCEITGIYWVPPTASVILPYI